MQTFIKRIKYNYLTLFKHQPINNSIHLSCYAPLLHHQQISHFSKEKNLNQFDKISNYESLISNISQAENINDIIKIVSNTQSTLKNEHIVLALRMMARLIKKTSSEDLENLTTNQAYKQFIEKASAQIDTLNEFEILDFLFWMRKFRIARVQLMLTPEAYDKFYARVNEFLKQRSFNFRNLVNLYFDFSFLQRNCDVIAQEILKELKTDLKLLTPFTVIQILQAASKNNNSSFREQIMVDYVARNFDQLLDEFDSDQLCQIFKYIAMLELNYSSPRHRLPPVLFNLRASLKEKLDQLGENSVINLMLAYNHLPRDFPSDLLKDIKEMVFITIQHNSQNMQSFFLLDFVETLISLRRRRPEEKNILLIADEIANRLPHDDFLSKSKNFERVVYIYDNGFRSPKFQEAIFTYISSKGNYIHIGATEALVKQHYDLKQYLQNTLDISKLGAYQIIRVYVILNFIKQNEVFKQQMDAIKIKVDELIANEPQKLINIIKSCTIDHSQIRHEILSAAITSIITSTKIEEDKNFYNFSKIIVQSIERKDHRILWQNWLNENKSKLTEAQIHRFIDSFCNLTVENFVPDQILFFLNFIQQTTPIVSFKKILNYLKNNTVLLIDIVKNENISKRLFFLLTQLALAQPEQIHLQSVYSLALRLEAFGLRTFSFTSFLQTCFEKAQNNNQQQNDHAWFLKFQFSLLLIPQNNLDVKIAKLIYAEQAKNIKDITLRAKYFGYIIANENYEYQIQPEIQREASEILAQVKETINSGSIYKSLVGLSASLSFPKEFLEKDREFYIKTLKEFTQKGTVFLYQNLIFSLQVVYVKKNYDFYYPFIKELINSYPMFNKRLVFGDIIRILVHFTKFNCKHPMIYNYILADIGQHFKTMHAEDRLKIMGAFSQMKLKQKDFIQKNIEIILQNPIYYKRYLSQILHFLYKIGFDNKNSYKDIVAIFELLLNENDMFEVILIIKYLLVLQPEDEEKMLTKYFNLLQEDKFEKYIEKMNKGEIVLMHHLIAQIYPQYPEWTNKLKKLLGNTLIEDVLRQYFKYDKAQEITAEICKYLKTMNVQTVTDFQMNDIMVDIFIPDQKIVIQLIMSKDINFDKNSYGGRIYLLKRLYGALTSKLGYKQIFLNKVQFLYLQDHLNRVKSLTSEGIQNLNADGVYDFKNIKLEVKKQIREQSSSSSSDSSDDEKVNINLVEDASDISEKKNK